MTRHEWIKNMDADEWVRFLLLMDSGCSICSYEEICRKEDIASKFCISGVNDWLRQEYKDG